MIFQIAECGMNGTRKQHVQYMNNNRQWITEVCTVYVHTVQYTVYMVNIWYNEQETPKQHKLQQEATLTEWQYKLHVQNKRHHSKPHTETLNYGGSETSSGGSGPGAGLQGTNLV